MLTHRRAVLGISFVTFLWGLPALFIHFFRLHFDPHTQNFWRYLAALVFLVIYGRWTGQLGSSGKRRALPRTALAALALVLYQTFFTTSLYHGKPALVGLLIQLELVVALALSCLFFADERRVASSPWFLAGAVATLAGAAGMVVFSREFAAGPEAELEWKDLLYSVALVAGAATFWACYSVAVKWSLEIAPPFPAFISVAAMSTAAFLVLGIRYGDVGGIARAPGFVVGLIVLSAVGCIGLAQVLYTASIQRLGVVVCNTVILASPVVTAICSRLVFRERLTGLQVVSAAVLLGGAAAAVQARARSRAPAAESDLEKDWTSSLPRD